MKKIFIFVLAVILFSVSIRVAKAEYYTSFNIPSTYENYGTPRDMTTLPDGTMWYADPVNYRIVKINTSGTILRTIGRSGTDDGEFEYAPNSITTDPDGYLYVLDACKVYKMDFNGGFIKSWGSCGDTPASSEMSGASVIHYDSFGNQLLVSDTVHDRIVKFSLDGDYVSEFGIPCDEHVNPLDLYSVCTTYPNTPLGQLNKPNGLTTDSSGNIYVVEDSNHRVQVFANNGTPSFAFGSRAAEGGHFLFPKDIEIVSGGYIVVTSQNTPKIVKYTSLGVFDSEWGVQGTGDEQFTGPQYLTKASDNSIWVEDLSQNKFLHFSDSGTYLGRIGNNGATDGKFSLPFSVDFDNLGNMFVLDSTHRVQKFDSNGVFVSTVVASGTIGSGAYHLAISPLTQNIFVSEETKVWVFDSSGTILGTLGSHGANGVNIGDGDFNNARGMAFDSSGNIYVADSTNNRIQKFDPSLLGEVGGGYLSQWNTLPAGVTWRGVWAETGDVYDLNDLVDYAGNFYVSRQANNLNHLPTDTDWWSLKFGAWETGVTYNVNEIAYDDVAGSDYISIQAVPDNLERPESEPLYWTPIVVGNDRGGWVGGGPVYSVNDFVDDDGATYVSKQNSNMNNIPSESKWDLVTDKGNWADDVVYAFKDLVTYLVEGKPYVFVSMWGLNLNNIPDYYPNITWWYSTTDGGAWDVDTTYVENATVTFNGNTYISKSGGNTGNQPDIDWWDLYTFPGNGEMFRPTDIFIDSTNNVYVSSGEAYGWKLKIEKYNSSGVWQSTFLNGYDYNDFFDGTNYNMIGGLSTDSLGNVFITDPYRNDVVIYDSGGSYVDTIGTTGTGNDQYLFALSSKVNPFTGDIVTVDRDNHRLQIIQNGVKINNLISSADVVNVSNDISLVSNTVDPLAPTSADINAELYFGDYPVSDFSVDLTADRDWAPVGVITLPDQSKSLLVNLDTTNAPGISATHSLYITKQQGQTSVTICPNAGQISDVTGGCGGTGGEYTLNEGDPTLSVVTVGSQEYWKVTGLTGTGGFSSVIRTYNISEPTSVKVGDLVTLEVAAKRDDGIDDTTYTGTVHFTTSPGTSTLPDDYTFTSEDGGVHTFTVISFSAVGTYTLTVADTVDLTRTQTITIDVAAQESDSGNDNNDNNNNNNNNASSSSSSGPSVCTALRPGLLAPYIWKTESLGGGQVKLYFNDAERPITDYHIVFGLKPGKYIYGGIDVARYGDKAVIISWLKPNTTYYFKLIPYNGCASGTWSNEVSIKSGRKYSILTTTAKKAVSNIVNKITGKTDLITPLPTQETTRIYNANIPTEPVVEAKDSFFTKVLKFFGIK